MKNEITMLKEQLMTIFNNPKYLKQTTKQLLVNFNDQTAKGLTLLSKALNQLEDEYLIVHDESGRYDLLKRFGLAHGTIDIKENGFGFVTSSEHDGDFYVPKDKVNTAIFGDFVLIKINRFDPKGPSAEVIKVTKRARQYLYGVLHKKGKRWYIVPNDIRIKAEVRVKDANLSGAKVKQMVKVYLTKYDMGIIYGEIVAIIGNENAKGVDITTAVLSAGFKTEFPSKVLDEVAHLPNQLEPTDYLNRRDLRDKVIVTIDGDDAKDFDDAIHLTILANGNYLLGVYIADVSHYVKAKGEVDNEAVMRGFSIYLPDRVYPMLPEKLSNGLCSLKPNEDRLVVALEMEIDKKGELISHELFEGVINSKARLTYQAVNQLFNHQENEVPLNIRPMLFEMNNLAKIIQKRRYNRGSLDFNVLEAKIVLNQFGGVDDVVLRMREDAEKLIEEFMIFANEVVATNIEWLKVPFIYRIHENPKEEKLAQFKAISRLLGYNIPEKTPQVHSKTLQKVLEESKDLPYGVLLHNLMLRSMAKARYDSYNIGHYGLASQCYTHFTSPIRRYPDLLVHRLLKTFYLNLNDKTMTLNDEYQYLVNVVAKTASLAERLIERLERDVADMKKCEYMSNFIGEEFKGVISSVTSWGFYVELPNTIEGLVGAAHIGKDYYLYNEEKLEWFGKNSKKSYRIGDQVEVILLNASKERRQIDFQIKE